MTVFLRACRWFAIACAISPWVEFGAEQRGNPPTRGREWTYAGVSWPLGTSLSYSISDTIDAFKIMSCVASPWPWLFLTSSISEPVRLFSLRKNTFREIHMNFEGMVGPMGWHSERKSQYGMGTSGEGPHDFDTERWYVSFSSFVRRYIHLFYVSSSSSMPTIQCALSTDMGTISGWESLF